MRLVYKAFIFSLFQLSKSLNDIFLALRERLVLATTSNKIFTSFQMSFLAQTIQSMNCYEIIPPS